MAYSLLKENIWDSLCLFLIKFIITRAIRGCKYVILTAEASYFLNKQSKKFTFGACVRNEVFRKLRMQEWIISLALYSIPCERVKLTQKWSISFFSSTKWACINYTCLCLSSSVHQQLFQGSILKITLKNLLKCTLKG